MQAVITQNVPRCHKILTYTRKFVLYEPRTVGCPFGFSKYVSQQYSNSIVNRKHSFTCSSKQNRLNLRRPWEGQAAKGPSRLTTAQQ
jgi:hypothetical protein